MESIPPLPLPVEQLPQALHRFADPSGPSPARMMAAKGMVPVRGADLVVLLVQLSADADQEVSGAAVETLAGLPENVLLPSCEQQLPASILHELAVRFGTRDDVLERLAANHAVADKSMARIALHCSERISEIVAVNQQRLLGAPEIIEALYKNANTRMSTADRLIELAARNGVELTGIPMFHEHVKAIQGQLIPEPGEEPLPTDAMFSKALEEDSDEDAMEQDDKEGTEELKEEFQPLGAMIRDMNIGEKIRLALLGNAAARSILLRDPNKIVAMAAISSPTISENEARNAAKSKDVSDEVLRYIGKKREWIRSYEIKHALVTNPKTPLGISMNFLNHLRRNDVRLLSRSRNIPAPLRQAARRRAQNYG